MEVHRKLKDLPSLKNAVVTIGTFDGVHLGHRKIISRIISKAKEVNGESVIMTFHPHPRQIVFPNDDSLRLLSAVDERIELLEQCGVDHLIIIPFTKKFAIIDPRQYIENILIDQVRSKHIIIGYDHRFGLNRKGDFALMQEYAHQGYFSLEEIDPLEIDDLAVSSTKIRNSLQNGDIRTANQYLGYPYRLSGTVQMGKQQGSELGFPTANLKIEDQIKLIPAGGIYAAHCLIGEKVYRSMVYIGDNRTLESGERKTIEINLFEYSGDPLYNQRIEVHLMHYVRTDKIFSNKNELIFNINQDKIECQNYFTLQLDTRCQKATIVVLNYNGRAHLENYLPTLADSTKSNHELLVIDNGSTDDSVDFVKNKIDNVNLTILDKNYGYAGGYNRGLTNVDTKYIALINSDIRGTEGWLDRCINYMEQYENVAAVQPKILADENPGYFEYAGAAGGFIDRYGYPFCRGRMMDYCEPDEGQYDEPMEIFWASGAALVIRTEIFNRVGGFDTDFFAHMEEIDLCWRIKKLGYQIMCEPRAVVYHLGGGTLAYQSPFKAYLNMRNNWSMILKNESNPWTVIPVRMFIDLVYLFKNFIDHNGHPKSIIKAWIHVFRSLSKLKEKRKNIAYLIRRTDSIENTIGRIKMSLPWQVILRKKRRFSDIKYSTNKTG